MTVLRATQRLLPRIGASAGDPPASNTALGDWYANRLVVDRRPLLILVSARSLLAILTPARDVRTLPPRLPDLVADRLCRLGIAEAVLSAETAAMAPVHVAKTHDRSVVGIMVDFVWMIRSYLPVGGWDETTLPFVEARLAETPCHAGGRSEDVVFPDQATPALLEARWR